MPNDTEKSCSSSLLSSVTRMLDASLNAGTGPDNLITVLSLLCLFSIVNRNQNISQPVQTQPASSSNPLHKLLSDLTKGSSDGGGGVGGLSPDTLMSLLPLLNSPQLKSKLNPATMGTVLGLINNLSGAGGGASEKSKPEPKSEPSQQPVEPERHTPSPASEQKSTPPPQQANLSPQTQEDEQDQDSKNYGRYLNWKNNF
ncbi:hypothetical protein SCACP_20090 [Sporomusa carbonis]|uniref:hypothetical protein n=1 Tax=Sporomusa carbonis TaxID=3076075 RepID=UPI003A77BE55